MDSLTTLLEKLQQPIPFSWRVQSRTKDRSKALCTAYIDARDVMRVLDQHCFWEVEYKEINGFIFAGIGISLDGAKYWRWDCGQRIENDPQDQMYDQAGKSAASDAFKRAAVMWGVGRFLYDLEMVSLQCDDKGNPIDSNGKRIWDITAHINGLKSGSNKPTEAVQTSAPTLDIDKYNAMIQFIQVGKWKDVESAIKKYELTLEQKTNLTGLINKAKSEAVTKAVKK